MRKAMKVLVIALITVSVIAISFAAGFGSSQVVTPSLSPEDVPPELSRIWEAWAILSVEYVDKEALDPDILSEGAIKGMLDALDDPFTSYLDPELLQLQDTSLRGKFDRQHETFTSNLFNLR